MQEKGVASTRRRVLCGRFNLPYREGRTPLILTSEQKNYSKLEESLQGKDLK